MRLQEKTPGSIGDLTTGGEEELIKQMKLD